MPSPARAPTVPATSTFFFEDNFFLDFSLAGFSLTGFSFMKALACLPFFFGSSAFLGGSATGAGGGGTSTMSSTTSGTSAAGFGAGSVGGSAIGSGAAPSGSSATSSGWSSPTSAGLRGGGESVNAMMSGGRLSIGTAIFFFDFDLLPLDPFFFLTVGLGSGVPGANETSFLPLLSEC